MAVIALRPGISEQLKAMPGSGVLSYFFCESSAAVSVVKGLIYLLAIQHPNSIEPLRQRYDIKGKRVFEDDNAFFALQEILVEMLSDISDHSDFPRTYLVIDALDECDSGLQELLNLIVHDSPASVKWLVTSRKEWCEYWLTIWVGLEQWPFRLTASFLPLGQRTEVSNSGT